ncbi:alkaline phosphatase family protein [Natrarchaeobius chitinivorans]|uniref:Nucleotide pyrophosphatase n=1 Tax=Natrarchaeobius chitinivorans TaxID=1679083 RepID=A0A3N6M640_NATCH|nr:alkaline phosphatase family protein [Natrarchaeobius chitinivorans]RQG96044.1 nucleotide pyrophosphatase [Natrarchaeobius chitinivorans]
MNTLVIGLDGGEWDVVDPMIEDGRLPNLERLKETGVSGPLESITPPVSPPAWNSIQTGTNPGKHGIFDFSTFDEEYRRTSINASHRRSTPFWTVMNDHGTTTGLFKVPFTYPPGDVDGYLVSGFPTPNSIEDFVQPEALRGMIGSAENLFEDKSLYKGGNERKFKENLIEVAKYQTELFLELVDDHETEFAMTVYDGCDRIQHYFWKYLDESHPRYDPNSPHTDAIERYYETVDEGIGRIIEQTSNECDILVISDHGFGPLSYDIYIDEWLDDEGFLTRDAPDSPSRIATKTAAETLQFGWNVVGRAGLQDLVKSVLPASWFELGNSLQDNRHQTIIWDESETFFSTLSGQALFINLKGRFTEGTVTREEYEAVVERVRESLLSIQHPETDERLVETVARSDEVYSGWTVDDAPDLIVRTNPEYTLKNGHSEQLILPSKQYGQDRSGDHRTDGMFIASGPSFDCGTVQDASIMDIAPTLLHIHGCPIPKTIDGEVLQGAIAEEIKETMSIEYTNKYGETDGERREWNESEEEALEERLSNMGYLN